MRVVFAVALVCVVSATKPMPVSLGEIMGKIESGSPKDTILVMINHLQRDLDTEFVKAEHRYESLKQEECVANEDSKIQTNNVEAEQNKATIKELNKTNTQIQTVEVPKHQKTIDEADSKTAELEAEIRAKEAKMKTLTEEFKVTEAELEDALKAVDEIRHIVSNSNLSKHYVAGFLQGAKPVAEQRTRFRGMLQQRMEDSSANKFRKQLASMVLKRFDQSPSKTQWVSTTYEILYNLRGEFDKQLTTETADYNGVMNAMRDTKTRLLSSIEQEDGTINDAKQAIATLMVDFADNDLKAAGLATERTLLIDQTKILVINEARRKLLCKRLESTHATEKERYETEKASLGSLHATVDHIDEKDWEGLVTNANTQNKLNEYAAQAKSDCYCDRLCVDQNDCCPDCPPVAAAATAAATTAAATTVAP